MDRRGSRALGLESGSSIVTSSSLDSARGYPAFSPAHNCWRSLTCASGPNSVGASPVSVLAFFRACSTPGDDSLDGESCRLGEGEGLSTATVDEGSLAVVC